MFNPSVEALRRDRATELGRQHDRAVLRAQAGIAEALRDSSFFATCSKRELRLVAKLAGVTDIRSGTKLVTEGDHSETMYVLLSGHAAVHRSGRKIAELDAGAVVGELAAMTKAPRNATVTALTDCQVAAISRRSLNRLLDDAPAFARKLIEALALRVRDLDRREVC